jgi:hypothetical protein
MSLRFSEELARYDGIDEWSFFVLNGCPRELMMMMARLAKMASVYEQVRNMEWTTFDLQPVTKLVQELEGWQNPEESSVEAAAFSEDDPNDRRNRFHCIEAWRHAIILYIFRVFHRPQTPAGLRSIKYLARVVLDHVRCIPPTIIIQKQTLLPVFLAGSEVADEPTKDLIRDYCEHWSRTARYSMFASVRTLLERIWQEDLGSTNEESWWGLWVGQKCSGTYNGDTVFDTEILLG